MQSAPSNAGTPAHFQNKLYLHPVSTRALFTWSSTRHNTCLTLVAEEENYSDMEEPMEAEIVGLQLSPMYALLVRDLQQSLRASTQEDDQHYALIRFAARCFRAGELFAKRAD